MDITSLIESAKQLTRQYERNAMNAEVLIERISGFNQDALALGQSRAVANDSSQHSPSNGLIDELDYSIANEPADHIASTMKRTRAALLNAVQSDSNQLKILYEENQSLKQELSEYQFGLELIMSKYRRNILECLDGAQRLFDLEQSSLDSASGDIELQKNIIALTDQVEDMRTVLTEQVISSNTDTLNQQASELHQLKMEFDTLREMCEISRRFGSDSLNHSSSRTDTPDTVVEK